MALRNLNANGRKIRGEEEDRLSTRYTDALEYRLAQDLVKFRRMLVDQNPELGKSELQRRIGDYAARRRMELEARPPVDA